jgi:superfamily II DNA or RNA helicase
MKKRLLVLAHREELLLQAREKFLHVDPELKAALSNLLHERLLMLRSS